MPPLKALPILTLTLNPALDLASEVAEVVPGPKLRCSAPQVDPGGGGINVARAMAQLGGEAEAMVALGGATGVRLGDLIRAAGLVLHALPAPGETRESLTITETGTGRQFRFVLPGPVWTEADLHAGLAALSARAPQGFLVISGSLPPGLPDNTATRLAQAAPSARIVLDTSGAALACAVRHPIARLDLLRMDHEEAEALATRPLPARADSADFAQHLVRQGVATTVIVARGADGSVLAEADRRLFCAAPQVRVKSKVGAGDSFVGGYVLARARHADQGAALALGVAAAAAAVMTDASDLCRREDVERLLPLCRATPI